LRLWVVWVTGGVNRKTPKGEGRGQGRNQLEFLGVKTHKIKKIV